MGRRGFSLSVSSDYAGALTRREFFSRRRSSHDGIAAADDGRHAGAELFAADGGGVRGGGGEAGEAFRAFAGSPDERGRARVSGASFGEEDVVVAVQSDRGGAAFLLRDDAGPRGSGGD